MFKKFFSLTKPGIIFGNLITTAGGFLLASRGNINYYLFLSTLISISLIIACGCVLNNYIDQDIDRIMDRTKNRVLVKGLIPGFVAIIYGLILGIIGIILLYITTNLLTVTIAIFGLFVYVVIYSLCLKRNSTHGTLIGGVAGSIPPVVGYCAVTNSFDIGALLLFLILSLWQMPHAFAIAIYRLNDYAKANIPVVPVTRGINNAKIQMLVYLILYIIATLSLFFTHYTGKIYLIAVIILSVLWLKLALNGFKATLETKVWARKMFLFSIINLTLLCVLMAIDYL